MSETETVVCSISVKTSDICNYFNVNLSIHMDYLLKTARSEVLKGVTMKSNTYWDVIPFSLVEVVSGECTTSPQG